jgi:hypothetical protein
MVDVVLVNMLCYLGDGKVGTRASGRSRIALIMSPHVVQIWVHSTLYTGGRVAGWIMFVQIIRADRSSRNICRHASDSVPCVVLLLSSFFFSVKKRGGPCDYCDRPGLLFTRATRFANACRRVISEVHMQVLSC